MSVTAALLYPPPELASCVSTAVVRDTRDVVLSETDRLNFFPASPLMAVTVVLSGDLRMSIDLCTLDALRAKPPVAVLSVTPPQTKPVVSWSPGPVYVMTIGFYPDAWVKLGGEVSSPNLPTSLARAVSILESASEAASAWARFCGALSPIWAERRAAGQAPPWMGSHRVADWARHMFARLALSGPGQSARSLERRLKRWTGQSRQMLEFYAQIEELYRLRRQAPQEPLAAIAADARFSDQSHMGRAVKRATGFSPARLNQLIETDEAFWCYRLIGEGF